MPDTAQPWPFAESDAQNTTVSIPPIPATQPQPTLGGAAADAVEPQPLSDKDRRWLEALKSDFTFSKGFPKNRWGSASGIVRTLLSMLTARDTALAQATERVNETDAMLREAIAKVESKQRVVAELAAARADTAELGRQLREAQASLTVAVQDAERERKAREEAERDLRIEQETCSETLRGADTDRAGYMERIERLEAALQAAQAHRERLADGVRGLARMCDDCECDGSDAEMAACRGCSCEVLRIVLAEPPAAPAVVVKQAARPVGDAG